MGAVSLASEVYVANNSLDFGNSKVLMRKLTLNKVSKHCIKRTGLGGLYRHRPGSFPLSWSNPGAPAGASHNVTLSAVFERKTSEARSFSGAAVDSSERGRGLTALCQLRPGSGGGWTWGGGALPALHSLYHHQQTEYRVRVKSFPGLK